ncbi:MAG: 50S ribosomal protein L6 [Candidatus Cloacimonadota bacterium]|nr:MAG: 50S ribosomal protein L6 [Candidatus Cloacimonadota bacterium]
MSRIGNKVIRIPQGVEFKVNGNDITVKGKLGELSYTMLEGISLDINDDKVKVLRENDTRIIKARHGLTRALLANMVVGVSEGYMKELHVIGTGYNAENVGPWLKLSLGYSHDILMEIPKGITVETEAVPRTRGAKQTVNAKIRVKGINKEDVGKIAAEIRKCRPPENYKGKGIRYSDEFVRILPGKSGAK